MSYGDEWNSDELPPIDDRERVRNPYMARELLKAVPVEPSGHRMPVAGDIFNNDTGKLLNDGVVNMPWRDAIPSGTTALLFPADYDRDYGEALKGTAFSHIATPALRWHLQVPFEHFAAGTVYNKGDFAAHAIIMDKKAYVNMAKSSLRLLADAQEGADLLGLKSAELFRQAISSESSTTRKIIINLMKNAPMTDSEMRSLQESAVASENYEFVTLLKAFRTPAPGGPGNLG